MNFEEDKETENTVQNDELEVQDENLVEPKEAFAEQAAHKEINYAAALKEKNKKIQEEKQRSADLEEKIKELESDKENIMDLGFGDDETKKELAGIKKELEKYKEEITETRRQIENDKQRRKLNDILANLKEKYKNSQLPFDTDKVLIETLKQKPDGTATPQDIEIVYRSMLLSKMEEDKHREEGTTEGSSQVGVEPNIKKHLDYDASIERWLKRKK